MEYMEHIDHMCAPKGISINYVFNRREGIFPTSANRIVFYWRLSCIMPITNSVIGS